jgi:hypothetical protein
MGSAYAQFKLNDNAANTSVLDSIGGNDGVANGNTSSFSTTGKINSAFAFNGTSKSVDLSNLLSGIKGDDVGSISVWVKPVNDTGAILSFNGNGGSFSVDWYKANQSANFSISGAGTPISCTTQTGSLPTNVFSHLVITQDGTQFKIYLNGVLQTITYWYNSDPGAWLSFLPSTINNAKLGSTIYQGAEYFFQGSADDLRYYKRALTANEVQALYSNGSGTEAPNPLAAP